MDNLSTFSSQFFSNPKSALKYSLNVIVRKICNLHSWESRKMKTDFLNWPEVREERK